MNHFLRSHLLRNSAHQISTWMIASEIIILMLTRFIVNQFSKFVTRRDWRSMTANSYWRNYTDDLHINSETYRFNSTEEMIKYVNED